MLIPCNKAEKPLSTGPLWGRGRLNSSDDALALESRIAAEQPELCDGLEHAGLKQERRALAALPANLSWQWQEDDGLGGGFTDIVGATSITYLLLAAQETNTIRVQAEFTDGEGTAESRASAATAAVAAAGGNQDLLQMKINDLPEDGVASTLPVTEPAIEPVDSADADDTPEAEMAPADAMDAETSDADESEDEASDADVPETDVEESME